MEERWEPFPVEPDRASAAAMKENNLDNKGWKCRMCRWLKRLQKNILQTL